MIDSKRLRRAIYLDVEQMGDGRYMVTGGAEPRAVDLKQPLACACPDAQHRRGPCKHVLAVRLATYDRELPEALRKLVLRRVRETPSETLRVVARHGIDQPTR